MTYREEVRDLFSTPDDYYLAHCISADFALGAGIAVEFNKRFDMKRKLISQCGGNYLSAWDSHFEETIPCIQEGRVFNLITKRNYWYKPTYETLEDALIALKCLCCGEIDKLAMPVIGCGLDRLQWDKVSEIIKDVFDDTDIEILVCKLK